MKKGAGNKNVFYKNEMEEEDDIKEEIVEDIDNDLVGLPG